MSDLLAAVRREIEAGLALARAQGIVCGQPQNIRIAPPPNHRSQSI